MRTTALVLALASALAAGCLAGDDAPPSPTPGDTNPEGIAPAVDVETRLFDRQPGVGLPPTTMGIDPARIELALGVPVNLTVLNDGSTTHNLVIDGLEVQSDDLDAGASQSILFTPGETGEFEMWCTIGGDGPLGHRAQGMAGTVVVG